MGSDYREKNKFHFGLRYALNGLKIAILSERNIVIHFIGSNHCFNCWGSLFYFRDRMGYFVFDDWCSYKYGNDEYCFGKSFRLFGA